MSKFTRREFLKTGGLALAGLTIAPSSILGKSHGHVPPSDRLNIAAVGIGGMGHTNINHVKATENIVALCDVDWRYAKGVFDELPNAKKYWDYRKMYDEMGKDIDAVIIATADHTHAIITADAMTMGKHVYCQKPLAYTISEGLAMVKAVRNNKRVLQVGSQQRSSKEFQAAIDMVQNGAIGHIEKIYARVGEPPTPLSLPEMPVPANLNFNQWMGPLNDPKIHYHPDLCPPISLDPEENEKLWGAWRWYQETGNGYTADWGAHMFDIAQAAIGMDGSGPVEFTPKGYNGTQYSTMRYANGIVMTEQPYLEDNPDAQGIKFVGDNGWIEVARGYINCSDQSKIPSDLKNLIEKRPRMMTPEERKKMYEEYMKKLKDSKKKGNDAGNYETSAPHMQNFIDCVRSRENPIAPVEVGCSTNTLCCLQNIARELGRPVKWNPATLSFGNDKEAASHRLYWNQYSNPYSLPYFCK